MNSTPLERVSGTAALLAPVLLLVSTVAFFTLGGGIGVGAVAGVALVFAMIMFAIALVGLARQAEPVAPRATAAVTALGLAGTAGGVGFGIDSIQAQLFGTPGLDEVSLAGVIALRVPGLLFPLSMIALAVLLGVVGRAPRALAATLGRGRGAVPGRPDRRADAGRDRVGPVVHRRHGRARAGPDPGHVPPGAAGPPGGRRRLIPRPTAGTPPRACRWCVRGGD